MSDSPAFRPFQTQLDLDASLALLREATDGAEIGRASCRERV